MSEDVLCSGGDCPCKRDKTVDYCCGAYDRETCKCLSPEVEEAIERERELVQRVGRVFESGAYRDGDSDKLDYEGFFSPLVLRRRAEYMHKHRVQSNGELRESDNWQKGIPLEEYMKSLFRHFMELWSLHRSEADGESYILDLENALCAVMFNCEGYLHELLKEI